MKKIFLFLAISILISKISFCQFLFNNFYYPPKRPIFTPQNYYYPQIFDAYNYQKTDIRYINTNTKKKKLRHIRKYLNNSNYLTMDFSNPIKKFFSGSLTGFSPSINQSDIYSQFDIPQYNQNKFKTNSSLNTELYSSPSGNENYRQNGKYYKDIRGTSGKTGVSIIYD